MCSPRLRRRECELQLRSWLSALQISDQVSRPYTTSKMYAFGSTRTSRVEPFEVPSSADVLQLCPVSVTVTPTRQSSTRDGN